MEAYFPKVDYTAGQHCPNGFVAPTGGIIVWGGSAGGKDNWNQVVSVTPAIIPTSKVTTYDIPEYTRPGYEISIPEDELGLDINTISVGEYLKDGDNDWSQVTAVKLPPKPYETYFVDNTNIDPAIVSGVDYAVGDTITLLDGTIEYNLEVLTVDTLGEVLTFDLTQVDYGQDVPLVPLTLVQDSTTGAGTGFEMTVDSFGTIPRDYGSVIARTVYSRSQATTQTLGTLTKTIVQMNEWGNSAGNLMTIMVNEGDKFNCTGNLPYSTLPSGNAATSRWAARFFPYKAMQQNIFVVKWWEMKNGITSGSQVQDDTYWITAQGYCPAGNNGLGIEAASIGGTYITGGGGNVAYGYNNPFSGATKSLPLTTLGIKGSTVKITIQENAQVQWMHKYPIEVITDFEMGDDYYVFYSSATVSKPTLLGFQVSEPRTISDCYLYVNGGLVAMYMENHSTYHDIAGWFLLDSQDKMTRGENVSDLFFYCNYPVGRINYIPGAVLDRNRNPVTRNWITSEKSGNEVLAKWTDGQGVVHLDPMTVWNSEALADLSENDGQVIAPNLAPKKMKKEV